MLGAGSLLSGLAALKINCREKKKEKDEANSASSDKPGTSG